MISAPLRVVESPREESPLPPLARRALPAPSQAAQVNARPFPSAPPAFVIRAALWLRRAVQRLADRVVPPEIAMFERITAVGISVLVNGVCRHRVPDALRDGPLTAAEIAARTGTHADAMHRALRALASMGIFELGADGRFAHNRLSRTLVGGNLMRTQEWSQYFLSQSNLLAWTEIERTLVDGKNNFERLFGMSVWDWFEQHPDEREMFAQCMMGLTVADAPTVATLYPFGEVKTLCDVGGGRGTLLSEILVRHPHLRGTLCDAAGVLESARVLLRDRGVLDRVKLEPGSFFASVPGGAEAYLLKNILHDWDDERCLAILRNVRKAMVPGQRLLLLEALLERNDASGLAALADIQMMLVCSDGRERSLGEFHRLMRETGFEPARTFAYPTIAVIEGRAT